MVYPRWRCHIHFLLGSILLGLAAPMEPGPLKGVVEAKHMAPDLEAQFHSNSRAEFLHERPAEAGEAGFQALLGEPSGETDTESLTNLMAKEKPFKVKLEGQWAKLPILDWKTRIYVLPRLTEIRDYFRPEERSALGEEEYNNRKLKAFSHIRSLYTVACDHAQEWSVCFQEHRRYNQAAFVSMVESMLKAIYEDPELHPDARALAKSTSKILKQSKDRRFEITMAPHFTRLMDTTLSDPLARPSQKSPFIQNAPDFLRNLGQLEQKIQTPPRYSDDFWLSIVEIWIRKLLSSASQEIREGDAKLKARGSLEKIIGDPRIPGWITAEARRAMVHLDRLIEHLASPDSPIKPLPREIVEDPSSNLPLFMQTMIPKDELLHPETFLQPEVSALLLEPEKLRMRSEAEIVAYMAGNRDWREPVASLLMSRIDTLQNEANAGQIRAQISEVMNRLFSQRQPTVWLVFFSWVAKKAQESEAYHESLQDLEKPIFQIFKLHQDRRPVQNFAQAVEELIFEAGRPRTLVKVPWNHETLRLQTSSKAALPRTALPRLTGQPSTFQLPPPPPLAKGVVSETETALARSPTGYMFTMPQIPQHQPGLSFANPYQAYQKQFSSPLILGSMKRLGDAIGGPSLDPRESKPASKCRRVIQSPPSEPLSVQHELIGAGIGLQRQEWQPGMIGNSQEEHLETTLGRVSTQVQQLRQAEKGSTSGRENQMIKKSPDPKIKVKIERQSESTRLKL